MDSKHPSVEGEKPAKGGATGDDLVVQNGVMSDSGHTIKGKKEVDMSDGDKQDAELSTSSASSVMTSSGDNPETNDVHSESLKEKSCDEKGVDMVKEDSENEAEDVENVGAGNSCDEKDMDEVKKEDSENKTDDLAKMNSDKVNGEVLNISDGENQDEVELSLNGGDNSQKEKELDPSSSNGAHDNQDEDILGKCVPEDSVKEASSNCSPVDTTKGVDKETKEDSEMKDVEEIKVDETADCVVDEPVSKDKCSNKEVDSHDNAVVENCIPVDADEEKDTSQEKVTPSVKETESNNPEVCMSQKVIENDEDEKFDKSNCDLLILDVKEVCGKEPSNQKTQECVAEKDTMNVSSQNAYAKPVFEDITEDEDSEDDEQFENIELELDDLIDTPNTSGSKSEPEGSGKVLKESQDDAEESKTESSNLMPSANLNEISVKEEKEIVKFAENVNGEMIMKIDLPCENVDPSAVKSEATTDSEKPPPFLKKKSKSTARKSGRPVSQESAPLKRINMHPIKNVTMNIAEVENALKFDLDYAKKMKKSDGSVAGSKPDPTQGNTYKVISVTKSCPGASKKKRKKKGYDFPGCKKKTKKSRLSDDLASPGASSVDSVSLSESDLMETDSISSRSSSVPLSENADHQDATNTTTTSSTTTLVLPLSSSSLSSSTSLSSLSSISSSSKTSPVKPGGPAKGSSSNKMKSVLDMLHERSRLKASNDSGGAGAGGSGSSGVVGKGPGTTSTTTTTIMVSPPPNKPLVEGVKRKGTPRKRKGRTGKRHFLDNNTSSSSSSAAILTELSPGGMSVVAKQPPPSPTNTGVNPASVPTPVVMMVAQHSKSPGLRSLLPRNMIVSAAAASGRFPGSMIRPPHAMTVAPPPGSVLTPLPLVSTLPLGMQAVSMASLPGGVLTSLPAGSTIFTAVQQGNNANVTSIPGAALLNVTPPHQTSAKTNNNNSSSTSKTTPPYVTSSSPSSLLSSSSKSPKSKRSLLTNQTLPPSASPAQVNSESLRALLVGKPYALAHLTPAQQSSLSSSAFSSLASTTNTSSIVGNTPVVFQMLNTKPSSSSSSNNNLTTLVSLPNSHHQVASIVAGSSPGRVRSSGSARGGATANNTTTASAFPKKSSSSYSVIKSHYSAAMPPNGVSCLTPPKTPDTDSSSEVAVAASLTRPVGVGGQFEDNDVIPLCCCKINVPAFNKLLSGVTYCQALDSVDNKVLGCCNKVTSSQLVRPGVKIPFMAVCEGHRKRLALHQCCPGCGHFCTQGKFQQCRKEGTSSTHLFHKQCMFYRAGKQFCPHCGEETSQCEVELKLSADGNTSTASRLPARGAKSKDTQRKARMGPASKKKKGITEESKTFALPNKKSIDLSGIPVGPDQATLTRLCKCIGEDRPKKYRTLPKDLYSPASEGDMDKVFYLLMDGMDPNSRHPDFSDQTPLHAAAVSGSLGTVFVLEQFGAEIHAQNQSLQTPLMCAAESGHAKIVHYLIKAGAMVEDRGEDGMTSLHYAAKAGHLDVIKILLNTKKLNVNVQDDGGWTPIIWATESNLADIVHFLLVQGGDPNQKDNEENTGLHWSAYSGSAEIAEMFLDLSCELDTPNEHGDRPLHIAARQDHYDIIVHLLARGANVDVKNHKDETPIDTCVNKTGQVSMALKINQQLRGLAAYKLIQPERLLERDITMGREKNPVACVNKEDKEPCPSDYLYIVQNVETSPLNINNVITGLQSCRCKDDCSSMYCVCARSSVCCWYDKTGRLVEDFNLLEPPLLFECNRACRCWVNCNNRVVQNGIVCRLQLFRTNGRGWGVRTLMDIPKGTFVCEYIGELISDSEADRREDDSYLFDLDNKDGDTYCIDARKYGNVARFINHLCEPNLVPVKVFVEHQDLRFPRICFFSSREIKAYEELGFDYGEKFWIIKWKHFTCACQSAKCKYSNDTIQKTLEDYRLRYPDDHSGQEPA